MTAAPQATSPQTSAADTTTPAPAPSQARSERSSGAGFRLVFLVPGAVALLAGLDAALLLLGLWAPIRSDRLPEVHGIVMVLGFVGTLISLERAIALGRLWGYLAPAGLGAGALLLVSPAPVAVGHTALVVGAAALTAVYVPLWRRQRDDAVLVQAMGAALATGAAAILAAGAAVPDVLGWLVGFVVLTIAGERLELARISMGAQAPATLVALAALLVAGVVALLLWPAVGAAFLGLALALLTGWLALHDVARVTIRSTGLPRYMAVCMMLAYAWLGVAAAIWLVSGPVHEGPAYDALLHAVFLGFTVSMVMAHAPVILPAVLRRPLPYHPLLFVPVGLLHASLVLRIWIGDGLGHPDAVTLGGVLNIVSVLTFIVLAAASATGLLSPRRNP